MELLRPVMALSIARGYYSAAILERILGVAHDSELNRVNFALADMVFWGLL